MQLTVMVCCEINLARDIDMLIVRQAVKQSVRQSPDWNPILNFSSIPGEHKMGSICCLFVAIPIPLLFDEDHKLELNNRRLMGRNSLLQ